MSKIIPLIKANIKGFMRNWKAIMILVIMPLILILIIFASFNANGLRKISIGYSMEEGQTLDEKELNDALGSFAYLTKYTALAECTRALRSYREYVCVHISGTGPYILDVHYDNTREPVIWEVIERLDQAVRLVQKEHSKDIADDFLTKFQKAMNRLDAYDKQLTSINGDLDGYVREVDGSVIQLQTARTDLVNTLNGMDSDIASARSATVSARISKNSYVSSISSQLSITEQNILSIAATPENQNQRANALSSVGSGRTMLNQYNNQADSQLDQIESRINSYEQASSRGRTYLTSIDSGVNELRDTKSGLQGYKQDVASTKKEMQGIKQEFSALQSLDAETLVNPVVIRNNPTYIPDVTEEALKKVQNLTETEAAVKGASFISLQTIFPTVLVLITLFLSLLIGSFVALGEINATAHTRLRMIKGIFLPEFVASFLSSLIIVIIPVLTILAIGDWLFQLGVFEHALSVTALLFLLVGIFILIGFLLAYLVRKESLTLMISTFILVLLIFFTGFLLPLERMSPFSAAIAEYSPGALALSAFKQIVFYDNLFIGAAAEFISLVMLFIALLGTTLIVRWAKES